MWEEIHTQHISQGHVILFSYGSFYPVAMPKTTIQSLNPAGVSHKHKISVQSVCNTSACAQSPPGPRVQPQGANNKLTTLSCAPVSPIATLSTQYDLFFYTTGILK